MVRGRIWPNFKLIQALMYVIITCKYEKDPIKTNREKGATPYLVHLIQRLIGELIGYPWSVVRCPSVVVRPQFSNVFSSETAWPIKAKFYVEPPWEGGTKVYINGPGHMTKMAATPKYGKNLKKIFSRTG